MRNKRNRKDYSGKMSLKSLGAGFKHRLISGFYNLINCRGLSGVLFLWNRGQKTTPLSVMSYFGFRRIWSQSDWLNSSAIRKVPI